MRNIINAFSIWSLQCSLLSFSVTFRFDSFHLFFVRSGMKRPFFFLVLRLHFLFLFSLTFIVSWRFLLVVLAVSISLLPFFVVVVFSSGRHFFTQFLHIFVWMSRALLITCTLIFTQRKTRSPHCDTDYHQTVIFFICNIPHAIFSIYFLLTLFMAHIQCTGPAPHSLAANMNWRRRRRKKEARNGCLCIDIACKCQNAEQCEFF